MNADRVLRWYYAVRFACLGLMLWRPRWTTLVGTFESLVTLVALILGMGLRAMIQNDPIFANNVAIVTYQELIRILMAGSIACVSWVTGLRQLRGR